MLFFKEDTKEKLIIIIGCGRLGSRLANDLSDQGGNVLILDRTPDSFRRLSPGFGGLTLVGNCTDFETLHEAEIEKADYVIAVTDNDSVNIMVSQMAKHIFHVKNVIARLYDPERKCVVEGDDIHIICPAMLSAQVINGILDDNKETGEV